MTAREVREGDLLWTPSAERVRASRLTSYLGWLEAERGLEFSDYAALHAFSVEDPGTFWRTIWDYFEVSASSPPRELSSGQLPDAHFFSGARLNYAEHALKRRDDHPALVFRSESGERSVVSYAELAELVARARAGLLALGVGAGDRVAGLLPNRPEAVVAFLATASLGAIWSSCSPEFGSESVLDRFRQIEPKVLLAVDSYRYGGKVFDRRVQLDTIRASLPSLVAVVRVGGAGPDSFSELLRASAPLTFEPVDFEHPLWILYSSGTTGLPKAIVHGHGGILLEHLKALALHSDLGPSDRFFWFTTTGWMMWNFLVSGLLVGATVVLYDGSPASPDLYALWKLAEQEEVTYFGASAPYLLACQKAGLEPARQHDLGKLRSLGTTGAPLPADGFAWVYAHVHADLLLASVSGGTDVCTAFLLSCPLLPVHAGELQCAGLGADVQAFDTNGRRVVGEVGELVLTKPFPAMPVQFWNDPGDARRMDSYFSAFPGIWRHGDWVKETEHAGFVVYGRSDATLNRGGVRMGTSEFYGVVEALPEIKDSLVIDTGSLADASGELWLFVVVQPGVTLDSALRQRINAALRVALSPRHVPDQIVSVPAIPRTLNGKKLEIPVKKILAGAKPSDAAAPGTLAEPAALDVFVALAEELRSGRPS